MSGDLISADIPQDMPAIEREIGEIEGVMRINRVAYDRNEAKQSRLRTLYTAGWQIHSIISEPAAGADLMALLSRSEFEKVAPNGDYRIYLRFMQQAADVTNAVPGPERVAFINGIENLPPASLTSIAVELLSKNAVAAEFVDNDGVQRASKGYAGASIVREWGRRQAAISAWCAPVCGG